MMSMLSLSPLWWLLLPILGLPLWWHRQRRQTQKIQTLATAKFLPVAPPQLLRVWRWRDILLLLLRCLMLMTMLAILAGLLWSWCGDTVFVAKNLDEKWVQKTLQSTGFEKAQKIVFCAEKDIESECNIRTDHLFFWLEEQQAQWQTKARWLVLAGVNQVTMSGTKPSLQHDLSIRIAPDELNSTKENAKEKTQTFISIHSNRMNEWRRLFSVFEEAGTASQDYVLSEKYDPRASLVIWDQTTPMDKSWSAPLVWQTVDNTRIKNESKKSEIVPYLDDLHVTAELQESMQASNQQHVQRTQQIWMVNKENDWPLTRMADAKKLFEAWQSVYEIKTYMQAQDIKAEKTAALSLVNVKSLQNYLLEILIILFALERGLAHVRRS